MLSIFWIFTQKILNGLLSLFVAKTKLNVEEYSLENTKIIPSNPTLLFHQHNLHQKGYFEENIGFFYENSVFLRKLENFFKRLIFKENKFFLGEHVIFYENKWFFRRTRDFFGKEVFFMRSSVFFRITVDFYVVPIAINPWWTPIIWVYHCIAWEQSCHYFHKKNCLELWWWCLQYADIGLQLS